jgi:hypothetical protein
LKAILLDGAFDAPGADLETSLAELLGNDVDRGVGIEEAMADDLSLDLVGANGIGLGSTFLSEEGKYSLFLELFEYLIIPLSRKAVFLRCLRRPKTFTSTVDEHEQARSDLIRGGDEQVASGPDNASFCELECHGGAPG